MNTSDNVCRAPDTALMGTNTKYIIAFMLSFVIFSGGIVWTIATYFYDYDNFKIAFMVACLGGLLTTLSFDVAKLEMNNELN